MPANPRRTLDDRMSAVVAALPQTTSKSEKMRRLGRSGFETADIARYLGVRYQFAYNVLNAAGLTGGDRSEKEQTSASGEPVRAAGGRANDLGGGGGRWAWAELDERGAVLLPDHMRESLGVESGDPVQIELMGDALVIRPRAVALHELKEAMGPYRPDGGSVAEDLIADRRAEAARDANG